MQIVINEFLEAQKNDDTIDVILDVDVLDGLYEECDLNRHEFPEDAWTVWITQYQDDRDHMLAMITLCNEGIDSGIELKDEEVKMILDYVKRNSLDTEHGLVLSRWS